MTITIDEFKKLEIKIGKIILAERISGADKLLRLICDVGPAEQPTLTSGDTQPILTPSTQNERKTVQILSGIAEYYDPITLVGKDVPLLLNLEPRTMRGLVSYGMMLTADADGKPTLLYPANEVPPGSIVK